MVDSFNWLYNMKENKKLKVGIAGYGIVGEKRRIYIDQNEAMEVVALCDIRFQDDFKLIENADLKYNYHKIEKEMKNYLISKRAGINYYRDFRKMLSIENLDILFVCLPNYSASEATMLGLKNNCHVFCEKPPGRSVKEIENVIECSKTFPNLKLKYGFNHRYHDSVKSAMEIIDSKKLGDVVSFRGVYGKSSIVPYKTGWRSQKNMQEEVSCLIKEFTCLIW